MESKKSSWLTLEQALDQLSQWVASSLSLTTEIKLGLPDALGYATSCSVYSPINMRLFNNSAMDGYAGTYSDLVNNSDRVWPVSQKILAGQGSQIFTPGSLVRIFTGAIIPEGVDTVVPQEVVEVITSKKIRLKAGFKKGQHIRWQGEEIKQGQEVLSSGTRLQPQHLGYLTGLGISEISVREKPRVAVVCSGDELVTPGSQQLQPGQIYNSNQVMLVAMLAKLGIIDPVSVHLPDNAEKTAEVLTEIASQVDLVVTTGGVSVGEADYISQFLAKSGQLSFWKLAIKPGKPLAFAHIKETPLIGLPGNPVAAYVCFQWFVRPMISALEGRGLEMPKPYWLPITFECSSVSARDQFLRVKKSVLPNGTSVVDRFNSDSSSFLSSLCWADGLGRIPKNQSLVKGDKVAYYSFEEFI